MDGPTFNDLLLYNIQFIKGEINETFYHEGPLEIDRSTPNGKQIINNLYKLNSLGFLL